MLGLLALAGCVADPCGKVMTATLLFGLSRPDGVVGEAAFTAFLDESVTPRFPAGLTVLDGAGRWRAGDGRLTQEASKVVVIVTAPGVETRRRLEAIRVEYRARFRQESVGLVLTEGCAEF